MLKVKKMVGKAEEKRIESKKKQGPIPEWQKWGPYVAERSWGTVREDYSEWGTAWEYFPFDRAHSKAYRWGEDAIAGWCDRYQTLVLAPAFWNGEDAILKERLFGLSGPEGNHGEDVKEYYYYLDGVPSHSYMQYLYKYPQAAFPYEELRKRNKQKTTLEPEYELIDTGIFENSRYFDIYVEYAKSSPEDFTMKIEAFNRGDKAHDLDIIPQVWFRNQWSWYKEKRGKPKIYPGEESKEALCLIAEDLSMPDMENLSFSYKLGKRYFYASKGAQCFFTENNTRPEGEEQALENYKDAFHDRIIKEKAIVNPVNVGTKACFHYHFPKIPSKQSVCVYVRCSPEELTSPWKNIDDLFQKRKEEADDFYESIHPSKASKEEKKIQRQALAGMTWNKQIYLYDVDVWLKGDETSPPLGPTRLHVRNGHWQHLNSMRIFAMPDKWEYPWFAAWDLAFHSVIWSLMDVEFAKEQLWLLLFDQFQHPNGQIPAYEWEFSDLNPPLQGWACLHLYQKEKEKNGKGDREFLEKCFHKLLMNFAWWVNKIDSSGNNVFEGGFLGLDNITVIERSKQIIQGMTLQQSDGTGWMAFFCLNLMRMALELSEENNVYESLATKFFEHYVYIAQSMAKKGEKSIEIWDQTDGFFYDVLRHVNGDFSRFPIRSLVGIIPIFAVEYFSVKDLEKFPSLARDFFWFLRNRKDLVSQCVIETKLHGETYYVLTPVNQKQLESILNYVWNPEEFRSEYGLRSLSKYHEKHPFEFQGNRVSYEPAESIGKVKGGNSNWRGPVWMPLNFLLIEALQRFSFVFGEQIQIKAPNESAVCLEEMARSFSSRLMKLFFLKEGKNPKPFLGEKFPFLSDNFWMDHYQFHEYFNPENGKGLGASHQSGWTSLIANVIDLYYKMRMPPTE